MKYLLLVLVFIPLSCLCQVGAYVPDSKGYSGTFVRPQYYEQETYDPQKEYSNGWTSGYKAGWCYGQGYGCIEPMVPMCPMPRMGEQGFKDGYNRGFIAGINARKEN